MTDSKPLKISLSKTIAAPAEKVFDHWLIPTFVGSWMFENEKVLELINEARPRGSFSFKVSKGGEEQDYTGEYTEIRRPDRLAFSWISSTQPDQVSQVMVQFKYDNNKTRVRFSQQLRLNSQSDSEQLVEQVKDTWSRRLNALAERFNQG